MITVFSDEEWRCLAPNDNHLNTAFRKVAYQNTYYTNAPKAVWDWAPVEIFHDSISMNMSHIVLY